MSIDLSGDRAVAQTKMTISQRSDVHGVLCDVVCTGRFYDFLERRQGRWGLVVRQPIYAGYRHLAYLQSQIGYSVKKDMPGLKGPEVEALYALGQRWLHGESVFRPSK